MPEKITPSIRNGMLDDLDLIIELGKRTFSDTFAKDNTPENMRKHLATAFDHEEIRQQIADPAIRFLIAEIDGKPVGFAQLHAGEVPGCVNGEKPIEIVRIYSLQEYIGCGIGAALMQSCLDEAQKGGYQTIYLGVWEHNPRAQTFYERWGFRKVGEHPFNLGDEEQTDWVMERAI